MTIALEAYAGTAAIGAAEWSLSANASGVQSDVNAGIYQAFIDLSALQPYDVYQFKCYEKARSGDAQRVVFSAYFEGVQTEPIAVTPTLVLGAGWDMTLAKISGMDRSVNWRISRVS